MQALIEAAAGGAEPYHICAVASDRKAAPALDKARAAHIPCEVISPQAVLGAEIARTASRSQKRRAVSDRVQALAEHCGAELIVLAGFLTVLEGPVLEAYRGRIINLHPSLLPRFGGEGMWGSHVHEAVIAAGVKETGCTVHLVDAGCDTGRVLVQRRLPVLDGDTAESLAARLAPLEHEAIVDAVRDLGRQIIEARSLQA